MNTTFGCSDAVSSSVMEKQIRVAKNHPKELDLNFIVRVFAETG